MSFSGGGGSAKSSATVNAYNVSGPVPISRGSNRIKGSYVEAPWNMTENDEGTKRGKSYWYSTAWQFQHGPVQAIRNIYFGGTWVYGPISRSGAYTPIIAGVGDFGVRFRIHWGTAGQVADPRLSGTAGGLIKGADGSTFDCAAAPNLHPRYAGRLMGVWDTLPTHWGDAAGSKGSHIGDMELDTYTLNEVINPGGESERHGVNPIGSIYDLWRSSVYGLGMSDKRIPLASWQASAQAFLDDFGSNSYLSLLIDTRSTVDSVMQDLMDYYHGFMPRDADKILADWMSKSAVDTGALPVIKTSDFCEAPTMTDNDPSETYSVVEIKYKDEPAGLGDASLSVRSPFGRFLTDEAQSVSFDRPHIHDTDQARAWAQREIELHIVPSLTCEGTYPRGLFRDSSGNPLTASQLVLLRDDDISGQDYIARIDDVQDSNGKSLQIKLTEELGQRVAVTAAQGGTVGGGDERQEETTHTPGDITAIRGWVVPSALRNASAIEMAILCDYPSYATSAEVYLSSVGAFAGEEQQLDDLTSWTARGGLEGDIDAAQTEVAFTPGNAASLLSRSFGAAEVAAGAMLVLVGDEVMILGALKGASSSAETTTRPATDSSVSGPGSVTVAEATNSAGDKLVQITVGSSQTQWPYWVEFSRDSGATWSFAGICAYSLPIVKVPLLATHFMARAAIYVAAQNKIGNWTTSVDANFTSQADDADGGLVYTATRGAFGTTAAPHSAGERVWIFKRVNLQRWTHPVLQDAISFAQVVPINSTGAGAPSGALPVTTSDATFLVGGDDNTLLVSDNGSAALTTE